MIANSTETSLLVTTADAALAGNASISGTVTDDDSKDPVQGATVTLYEDGGIVFVASEVTAADGTYEFGTVVPDDYGLEFTATFYVTEWYDDVASAAAAGSFTVGDAEDVVMADAALTAGNASISGTVTDDDSEDPVQGATVTLYEDGGIVVVASEDTAADGTYEFGTVVSGDYDLEFTAAGYESEWYNNEANADLGSITVGNDEDVVADAALTAEPGSISGTVTDDDSEDPVEGATVTLYEDGGIVVVASEDTAADGTYEFGTVVSGDYDLEFTAAGYESEWYNNEANADLGSITVGNGRGCRGGRCSDCRGARTGSGQHLGNRDRRRLGPGVRGDGRGLRRWCGDRLDDVCGRRRLQDQ